MKRPPVIPSFENPQFHRRDKKKKGGFKGESVDGSDAALQLFLPPEGRVFPPRGGVPTRWPNASCSLQHRPFFSEDALFKPTQLQLDLPLGSFTAFTFKTPKKRPTTRVRNAAPPPVHDQVVPTTGASFHNVGIWNILLTTETGTCTFGPTAHHRVSPLSLAKEASTKGGGASQQTGAPGSVAAGSHVSTAKGTETTFPYSPAAEGDGAVQRLFNRTLTAEARQSRRSREHPPSIKPASTSGHGAGPGPQS